MSQRIMLAAEHLGLRLRPLNRALRAAVARQTSEAAELDRPDLTPYCITDEQVDALLDHVDAFGAPAESGPMRLIDDERRQENELRERAESAGFVLPLEELVGYAGLAPEEVDALLICMAPEVDRDYERIFAYVLDDLNRRMPCVELLCTALAGSSADFLIRRHLGSSGRLRRLGLVMPWGEAPTQLRQEFRVARGLVEFLMGTSADLSLLAYEPGPVPSAECEELPPNVDRVQVARLGRALCTGVVDLVGVWGAEGAGSSEVVRALAREAGMDLRRPAGKAHDDLASAVAMAAATQALLWIPVDVTGDTVPLDALGEMLSRSRTHACLSGTIPWRPAAALATRRYAEITLDPLAYRHRVALWAAAVPEAGPSLAADLAGRYRMGCEEIRAVAALAGTTALVSANGSAPRVNDQHIRQAAMVVADRRTAGFTHAVIPRRTPNDLVLPEEQHRQVLEIGAAYKTWPQVSENWGFSRHSGGSGVKVLFSGEPGTGKSLAAEVIAGALGLTLLKIDLAQLVSKWVGETEKNLEAAFQQAENSHAVLFFDEADALFGKRGEVKQGTDRYANLEIGFLLQRLEQSDSLVILASNLKENIDPAFTRRFHYIVHFPRPNLEERRRIWRLGFPPEAPLTAGIDLDTLAELDMTGAAIIGAARSAALLAADTASPITAAHVVAGVSRQYQRDARLLRPEDLGHYAALLRGQVLP